MNKKIYFTILLLAINITINSQCSDTVTFPDLNFKNALINQTSPLIDTNRDGEIQCSEANNFNGTIDVSDKSISDLTGIEAFPNITNLTCNNNNLTSIDISSNTSLERFFCNNNSIRNIDLSNNINLISINLKGNELRDVDLQNNTDLLGIDCAGNNINSLDLSKNNKLKVVRCDYNELITLNISNGNNTLISSFSSTNNPKLNCIQIDESFTPPSTWRKDSSANFSTDCQNTEIIDNNFEQALIDLGLDSGDLDNLVLTTNINSVENLDLSNKNITDLTGIENFVSLKNFKANDNNIKSIDLSRNVSLETLNLSNNSIENLTLSNTLLKNIDLRNNKLNLLDISKSVLLEHLNVSDNLLTEINLETNRQLKLLEIDKNQISTIDLERNTLLESLAIDRNFLTSLALNRNRKLFYLSAESNNLTELNLRNGNNTNFTTGETGSNFKNNPALTCILVDDKDYSNTNWTAFKDDSASYSTFCSSRTTIITDPKFEQVLIDLNIDAGDIDGRVLVRNIENVISLDVSNKEIENLRGIEDFSALEELKIQNNKLTSLDLENNLRLKKLNASNNQIETLKLPRDGSFLSNDLETLNIENNKLTTLNLENSSNLINLDASDNKIETLKLPRDGSFLSNDLETLNIENNKLTTLDLENSSNLIHLDASNNKIETLDLSNNNKAKEVYLQNNNISNLELNNNNELTHLNLNKNELRTINVTDATALKNLYLNTNKLSIIDLESNIAIEILDVSNNRLSTLDLSANIELYSIYANDNQLTSVDLKNGNNTKINASLTNFTSNPSLICIQVDNKTISDNNWSAIKDTTANFNEDCNATASNEDNKFVLTNTEIAPNPVTNTLNIKSDKEVESLKIYNIHGAEILNAKNTKSCNVEKLTFGVYILKITTKEGQTGVKRFVKK